jgi:hypothetical protein
MTDLTLEQHEHDELLRRRSIIAIVGALLLLVICTPIWLVYRASTSTASFADSEVLDKNRLGAAILDIEIGSGAVTFEASNLAPGDIVSGQLELKNAGTLPLIYEISGTSDGDLLATWLRFELWFSSSTCDVSDPADRLAQNIVFDPQAASFDDISTAGRSSVARGSLDVGQRSIVCIGARLLLEAPNEVQGRQSEIDIVVDAVHDIEADLGEAAG